MLYMRVGYIRIKWMKKVKENAALNENNSFLIA